MEAPNLEGLTTTQVKEELNKIRFPVEIAICGTDADKDNYFNSGACIRIAHSYLVKNIHFINRGKWYKRAAMGSHKYENITHWDTDSFLTEFSNKNIVCLEKEWSLTTKKLNSFQYPDNCILVFGSEHFGIPKEILNKASSVVSIEMYGIHNSLNIATAVAITLYDWSNKHLYGNQQTPKQELRLRNFSLY